MGLTKVLPEIPLLKASYATGHPFRLPVNITVSVSYRCNSRCKTCNVWLLPNDDLAPGMGSRLRVAGPGAVLVHVQRRRADAAQRPARTWWRARTATVARGSSTSRLTAFSTRSSLAGSSGCCRRRRSQR